LPNLLSAYGYFEYPSPEAWPAEALRVFGKATGARSLLDVFVFQHENAAALYFEDAIAALTVLPVTRAEWSARLGYPQVFFDLSKVEQYVNGLAAAGYRVVVMEKCSAHRQPEGNGKVISIASARTTISRRRHKWA